MHQPLTAHGAISLINLLVEMSDLHYEIVQWKAKHISIVDDKEADDETASTLKNLAYLEKKYWQTLESGTQK